MRACTILTLLLCAGACDEGGTVVPISSGYTKTVIDPVYRTEGVTAFDVDRDGLTDIVTYQFWFRAPDFTPYPIDTPQTFDPLTQYANGCAAFGVDLNGDGWTDLLSIPFNGLEVDWFENPRGRLGGAWPRHAIWPSSTVETAIWVDLFGDGRHELVMGTEPSRVLAYYTPAANPTAPWVQHAISAPGFPGAALFVHGLGVGDVDGDGRTDVLTASGWFAATADRASWVWHDTEWAPDDCAQMYVYDVNADGRGDVLCSSPHHYGVRWFEQHPVGAPGVDATWIEHTIDASFSESHALRLDDLDGDGVPEIITGKRFYSHGTREKGALDRAVLVYFRLLRGASGDVSGGRPEVDEDSGVGTAFEVTDVDGDGKLDILVANKKGLFYFRKL